MIPGVGVPDPETDFPGNRFLIYEVESFEFRGKVTNKSCRTTPYFLQKVVLVFHYDPYIHRKFRELLNSTQFTWRLSPQATTTKLLN